MSFRSRDRLAVPENMLHHDGEPGGFNTEGHLVVRSHGAQHPTVLSPPPGIYLANHNSAEIEKQGPKKMGSQNRKCQFGLSIMLRCVIVFLTEDKSQR